MTKIMWSVLPVAVLLLLQVLYAPTMAVTLRDGTSGEDSNNAPKSNDTD